MVYVTTGKAARTLGVGLNTVKRWISKGVLHGVQTPGGHWRIPQDALERFMQARGIRTSLTEPEHPLRVLIIDDDPAVCTFLSALLAHADFPTEVDIATDGYTGLIKAGNRKPDVLVVDIIMPGINGLEVLRRLRGDQDLLRGIGIVVITAAFDEEDVMRQVQEAKPDALLPKPVNSRAFLDIIKGFSDRARSTEIGTEVLQ